MSKYIRKRAVKAVTSAGTAEPLKATSLGFLELTVQAEPTNTGNIFIGGSDVDSTNGLVLTPGASRTYSTPGDLNDIYIDSAVDGEGVRYEYVEPV
jgi:hypothetical protein